MRLDSKYVSILMMTLALLSFTFPTWAEDDASGCRDPQLFTRMTGFHIYRCETIDFDRFEFPIKDGKTQAIEGPHQRVIYYANEGINQPSGLQITRNYIQAAKAVGGKLVYEFEDGGIQFAVLSIEKSGTTNWAQIEAAPNGIYTVDIVTVKSMRQDVKADAAAMASGLKSSGKMALYGIYFDNDQATLKPESDPTLGEIAKLLKQDAAIRVYVVGHTDSNGTFDHNLTLSTDRAKAVVKALTDRFGIASARLKPFGCGPVSPVESNQSEGGRARNRRVELVLQ